MSGWELFSRGYHHQKYNLRIINKQCEFLRTYNNYTICLHWAHGKCANEHRIESYMVELMFGRFTQPWIIFCCLFAAGNPLDAIVFQYVQTESIRRIMNDERASGKLVCLVASIATKNSYKPLQIHLHFRCCCYLFGRAPWLLWVIHGEKFCCYQWLCVCVPFSIFFSPCTIPLVISFFFRWNVPDFLCTLL